MVAGLEVSTEAGRGLGFEFRRFYSSLDQAEHSPLCLTATLATVLSRQQIKWSIALYGIACGYPDGNDAAKLSSDPVHKLLVGRTPLGEDDLASQPTLSRFDGGAGDRASSPSASRTGSRRLSERQTRSLWRQRTFAAGDQGRALGEQPTLERPGSWSGYSK